jgi:peptide subunit release factor 1 (eRF1)
MIDTTQDAIQVLLDRPKGQGMTVSCYADTSMTDGFQWLWSQHLKNEASDIERRLEGDPQALSRFERDLEIIRHALDHRAVQSSRGMAVFSAVDERLFQAFPLGVPVKDRLVLDEEPYLVPLLEAMHRQRRYLCVITDSHHGRLYEAGWGHTHLLGELDEDVPRRQKSAGETWGKQQATIERHRRDHLLHYRKDLASAVEQAWAGSPFRGIILLGEHEVLEALRAELPPALASRVVHEAPCSWTRTTLDLDSIVQGVLDDALRAHDAQLVAEFERRMHEHYMVAAGAQEVVDALHNGQVGYPGFLILEPDRGEMATRCTRCESLFTTTPEVCPFCQGACVKVNVWQEILLFAHRHAITAHIVASHPELLRHGGVAAVLSRAEPWQAASTAAAKEDVVS